MKIPFFEILKTRHYINKCFRADKKRFVSYSRALRTEGKDHIQGLISLNTHIIEKGLTMPQMRAGFGQEVLRKLFTLCRIWEESFDKSEHFYTQAVNTILEYSHVHSELGYSFEEPFASELKIFVEGHKDFGASCQPTFENADHYFSKKEACFPEFALSRHSVRHFSEENIPIQRLIDAVDLAQSAPSSCNRQTTRVHIITGKKDITSVLALQNGNRGFGQYMNKLLIITYYIPHYGSVKERHLGYIDSGIFTMNLLYALHYHQIGACTLNWCDSPKDEARLRSLLSIDDKETITVIIGCGLLPDRSFSVAKSTRLEGKAITVIH